MYGKNEIASSSTRRVRAFLLAVAMAATLAGCGGGGSSPPGTDTPGTPVVPVQPADPAPPVEPSSPTTPTTPPAPARPPSIGAQPSEITTQAGQPATFTVVADGDQPLRFEWLRNGQPIAGATGSSYTLPTTSAGDSGAVFSVRISNPAGSTVSTAVTLTVQSAPINAIALVAGTPGSAGSLDGPAATALFQSPSGLAKDVAGNLYITDRRNHNIRKLDRNGIVTTFAGHADAPGYDDGPLATAKFNAPTAIAADPFGNLFVADGTVLKKISPDGVIKRHAGLQGSTGGSFDYSFGSSFTSIGGLAVDAEGSVYAADSTSVRKIHPSGLTLTLVGKNSEASSSPSVNGSDYVDGVGAEVRFRSLAGIALDRQGNLYVTDTVSHTVRKIAPGLVVTTLAGQDGVAGTGDGIGSAARFSAPSGITTDDDGNVYVLDGSGTIRKITPQGKVSSLTANRIHDYQPQYGIFTAVLRDANGSLLFPGTGDTARGGNVLALSPAGSVSTVAGLASPAQARDGRGAEANFVGADTLAFDRSGNLFVSELGSRDIRRISPQGTVTTFFRGQPVDALSSTWHYRPGMAVDAAGNLYSNEDPYVWPYVTGTQSRNGYVVRRYAPDGTASVFAGSAPAGISAKGVDGIGADAVFPKLSGMAIDGAGNLFVGDGSGTREVGGMFTRYKLATLRKITPDAIVTTFIGPTGDNGYFFSPTGLAIDANGSLYMSDSEFLSISRISPQGTVTTLASFSAFQESPASLAVDTRGNVYAAMPYNHTVVRIAPTGIVSVIAGTKGVAGLRLGPLPGTLYAPQGLAIGPDGYLYISSAGAVVKIPLPP